MARKSTTQPPEDREEDAALRGSCADATDKINVQIERGRELIARPIQNEEEHSQARNELRRWDDRNEQLLGVLFTNSALKTYYHRHGARVVFSMMKEPLAKEIQDTRKEIDRKINTLQSIIERIDLFPEGEPSAMPASVTTSAPVHGNDVFIVHGRDTGKRDTVARFVQTLSLNPIILEEQANKGDTVIEKFERHAADGVVFAVVLITPDDVGGLAGIEVAELKPRARQNIILELGYFFGRLGRERVAALYVADTELPTDISGVVYIPFDDSGVWKLQLAKEMKAAGLPVDMNDMRLV